MATVYFYHASSTSFSDSANWWTDSIHTAALGRLPLVSEDIQIDSTVNEFGFSRTVVNMTNAGFDIAMHLTVSGTATFNSTAKNKGVVNGTCIFNATSENYAAANVVGTCTFNTSAKNYGTVTGTTIFNNASTNESGGVVEGSCTFNLTSSNKAGATVTGATTFNSSSTCAGNVNGACTFNTSSSLTSVGIVVGEVTVNNSAIISGNISGANCSFFNTSALSSTGVITLGAGYVYFEGTSACAGTVTATAVIIQSGCSIASTALITVEGTITVGCQNSGRITGVGSTEMVASINAGTCSTPVCLFNTGATNNSSGVVTAATSCSFIGATNDGVVTSPLVSFDDTSTNTGTVNSNDCKINNNAGNSTGVIVGVGNFYGATGTGIYADNVGGTVTGSSNSYWPATYPVGGSVTVSSNYFGYAFLQGQAQVGVRGIVDTLGIQDTVSLGSISSKIGLIARGKMNVPVTLSRALCNIGVKGTLRLTTADAGFTVKQALAAIYSVWGSGCSDSCDTAYTARGSAALDILNGCMQEILLNAKELQYLSRETISTTTQAVDTTYNILYYELPDNVQAVVGPVMFLALVDLPATNRYQCMGVSTKSQLINFSTYYNTPGKQTIIGYYIERGYQLDGERTRIRIYVSSEPAADSTVTLSVEVEREALRYRAADCASGTIIPLPHQYAESLLLPLIREAASASPLASRRDSFPMYQTAAASARAMFKLADPQNPVLESQPERKRKP